jgi:hypothetical protein
VEEADQVGGVGRAEDAGDDVQDPDGQPVELGQPGLTHPGHRQAWRGPDHAEGFQVGDRELGLARRDADLVGHLVRGGPAVRDRVQHQRGGHLHPDRVLQTEDQWVGVAADALDRVQQPERVTDVADQLLGLHGLESGRTGPVRRLHDPADHPLGHRQGLRLDHGPRLDSSVFDGHASSVRSGSDSSACRS